MERARRHTVWDGAGRSYLDFLAADLTVTVGHGNERVTRSVRDRLEHGRLTPARGHERVAEQLADVLAELAPGRLAASRFTHSAAEARLLAARVARATTGRQLLLTDRADLDRAGAPLAVGSGELGEVGFVSLPRVDRLRPLEATASSVRRCLEDLARQVDSRPVAGLVVAPIRTEGGFELLAPGYLEAATVLVRRAGGVMIVDEGGIGWGRSGGHVLAARHWRAEPDVLVLGDAMANGLPLGCVLLAPDVADAVPAAVLPAPGGNVLSLTAALATLAEVRRDDLPNNARRQGLRLRSRLQELSEDHDWLGPPSGVGLLQALRVLPSGRARASDPQRARALVLAARRRGLLVGCAAGRSSWVRLAPHLTMDAADIDDGCALLAEAAAAVSRGRA